jgi:hypothetical protein
MRLSQRLLRQGVPGLDGAVSADVLDVSRNGTYQIVTDLDATASDSGKPSIGRIAPNARGDPSEQALDNLPPNTMHQGAPARAKALKNQQDSKPWWIC